jgi:hypothetical protein
MPVHEIVKLRDRYLDQATPTRTHATLTCLRVVHGAVRCAHEPMTSHIKKPIGLVIHFHGHMAAAVQIRVDLPLVANGKRCTRLVQIGHIKGDGVGTVQQVS